MAVLQRVAMRPNLRFDLNDGRSLESFSLNDWLYFVKGTLTDQSTVVAGFEVTNWSSVFSGLLFKLQISSVVMLHPDTTTQSTGFYVTSGNEPDSTVPISANATNYVEADFEVVTGTPDVRAFWDPGANAGAGNEFTETVETVINLQVNVTSNVSGFTAGKVPLYKVVTNATNITSVTDCRPLLFRLGTGGTSPDPNYNFDWPNTPDAAHERQENPVTATSATATNQPFQGGDKNLKNLKQWMDAMMTSIKEIKGTPYWYSAGVSSSLPSVFLNAAGVVLVGGEWEHVTSGHLELQSGNATVYRLGRQNNLTLAMFPNFDLTTNRVLYIVMPDTDSVVSYGSGQSGTDPVIPKAVSALGATTITVPTGGNYMNAGGRIMLHGQFFTYSNYNPGTGVFSGVSPDPSTTAQVGDFVYQADLAGTGFYHSSVSSAVPGVNGSGVSMGAERVLWLALFDGSARIFLHNADLEIGEVIQVGDSIATAVLSYMGSPGEAVSSPTYTSSIRGVAGENLTARLGTITDAVGDEQEDRSAYFRSDNPVLWDGTQLVFNTDIILEIINTKSGALTRHRILAANSPLTFNNDGDTLYVVINRTAANENVTPVIVASGSIPAQTQANKDVIIVARKVVSNSLGYLWIPLHKQLITNNQTILLGTSIFGSTGFEADDILTSDEENNQARCVSSAGTVLSDESLVPFPTKDYDDAISVSGTVFGDAVAWTWRFTAKAPGVYSVKTLIQSASFTPSAGNRYGISLYRNGAYFTRLDLVTANAAISQQICLKGSTDIKLAAGQYIDIRAEVSSGTMTMESSAVHNFITVKRHQDSDQSVVIDTNGNVVLGVPSIGLGTNAAVTEPLTIYNLSDNQAVPVVITSWPLTQFTNINMEFSLTRGPGVRQTGEIYIITDGTTAAIAVTGPSIGAPGVTFSADVSGGNLRLLYTSTNTGINPVLKLTSQKWLA